MIRTTGKSRRGFTLVELLVVVGMIAVIMGALTTSVTAAQNRARIQKATADVHAIEQAILSYENFQNGDLDAIKNMEDEIASSSSLGFLLGDGTSKVTGDELPALLMVSLQSGGEMRDPWGHPYLVTIKKLSGQLSSAIASQDMKTGYMIPNAFRLQQGERE